MTDKEEMVEITSSLNYLINTLWKAFEPLYTLLLDVFQPIIELCKAMNIDRLFELMESEYYGYYIRYLWLKAKESYWCD